MENLIIKNREFKSRLFLGTGKFSSHSLMKKTVRVSGSQLVTVALKRFNPNDSEDMMINHLMLPDVHLLPNTSGVRTAKEAVFAAELAREALETNWIKLEIHPDPRYLLPDHRETIKAAEELVKKGFVVLPYINADPVFCKHLEEVGVAAVMPLGSPIGSNSGIQTRRMIEIIIEQSQVPVVIDAGLGAPSHATEAMEMGADAVLVNTAIAIANDPEEMAMAFKLAVQAGHKAYLAKLGVATNAANPSSPFTAFLEEPN